MRGVYVLLLISLLGYAGRVGGQESVTITQCYEWARANYPQIHQMGLIDQTERYSLSNVGKAWLPQLSVSGKASYQSDVTKLHDLVRDIYRQIEPFKHRRAGKLSGGMKQKLALSCALIHRPDVLFLDEPTTGVDPVSRSEFWDMLDRLKRQGITILVSTPYMDEASRCDRIALVRSGECLSIDTPVGIRTSFDRRLYAVRCASMYKLLGDLREFPDTNSCFAFGDAHHLTLRRDGEDVMRRLQEYLKGKGYADVSIERLEPSVEDCFMAL